jgi:5-methylcytosine-specific restriction endonuclease McrA
MKQHLLTPHKCLNCDKEFLAYKRHFRRFCGRKCANNYNDTKFQDGHKQSNTGRTWLKKGHKTWNKGISYKAGSEHYNWKKDRSLVKGRNHYEMKDWRKAVFQRDNYTCKKCGKRGGKLNADHIKSYALFPDLRWSLKNGRTLCVDCHKKTPTYARNIKYQERIYAKT